jgi:hypothetical protein
LHNQEEEIKESYMMKQKKGNDYLPHQADYDQEETHNHFQQQLCMTEEDDPDVRAK